MRTQRVNGVERWQKWNVVRAGLTSRFCSRTRVLRTSDAVEVLVRTPAARPLRAEQRCVGDRASWSSSSGCTSPYARCRGRRASSAPGERPRTKSRLRARTRCLAKSSRGGRAALRRMCCARDEDEWTVAAGQRDEVSNDARAVMTRAETMTCRTSRRVRPQRPSRRLLGLLRSLPRRR